jgi:predicted dehydrogenase
MLAEHELDGVILATWRSQHHDQILAAERAVVPVEVPEAVAA